MNFDSYSDEYFKIIFCNSGYSSKWEISPVDDEIKFISDVISSHMGEWNTNQYSKVILPKPETKYQKFIHLCDYLASRKFLNFTFDGNNLIDSEE